MFLVKYEFQISFGSSDGTETTIRAILVLFRPIIRKV